MGSLITGDDLEGLQVPSGQVTLTLACDPVAYSVPTMPYRFPLPRRGADRPAGAAPASQRPSSERSWVSKSDVTGYLRCPYAWWLLDTRQITRDEAMPPFVAELAAVGVDFETRATAGAQPVTIPPGTEKEFFRGERTVYLPPSSRLFRNEPLRLRGRPDGVVSAGGVVEPIEIKSHRRVRESDVIELAFYWRLLEPLRSVDAVPAGWVFLRSPDGSVTEQRMAIPAGVFAQLDAAIRGVRQARINGVPEDRFCRCAVCGGIKRDEVRRRAISAQDVSTVIGVGRSYGAALRACGVDRWPSLLAADPDVLADKVRFEDSKCRSVSANWSAAGRLTPGRYETTKPGGWIFPRSSRSRPATSLWIWSTSRSTRMCGDRCPCRRS